MKNKITKKNIFAALAILCGVGAMVGFRLNDVTAILSLLLMLLAGVFAYLWLRLNGLYVVFVMGIVQGVCELFGSSGDSPDGDLSGLFISAFMFGCVCAVLGMVGMIAGFLLKSVFDRKLK